MAGDWIKLEKSTPRKAEVLQLAQLLQIKRREALGLLVEWFCWVDDNCNASGVTPCNADVLSSAFDQPRFGWALQQIGWLKEGKDGCLVVNFTRHNGSTAKQRALTNQRVSNLRTRNAQSVTGSNVSSVTKSLPEKRREEVITTKTVLPNSNGRGSEPPAATAKPFSEKETQPPKPNGSDSWAKLVDGVPADEKRFMAKIAELGLTPGRSESYFDLRTRAIAEVNRRVTGSPPERQGGLSLAPDWWKSKLGIAAAAKFCGIEARLGESEEDFADRVRIAVHAFKAQQHRQATKAQKEGNP